MAVRITGVVLIGCIGALVSAQEPPRGNQATLGSALPARDQRLPPPSDQKSQTLKIISFEEYRLEKNKLHATNAHFEYRGYEVRAKVVEGDLETNIFELKGSVDVVGQSEIVRAEYVRIDFRERTYRLEDGTADIRPERLEGLVTTNVYVSAKQAFGSEEKLEAKIAAATTCNLDRPHYICESRELIVIPGERLTFKDVRLRVLGRTIFGLPRLDIPLDRNAREYMPEVGQSLEEGFYFKFKFPVSVRDDLLIFRTDLMTKKGVALGTDYHYESRLSKGEVRLYAGLEDLEGGIRFTASARHRQLFSFGDVDGSFDSRRFQFFGGPISTMYNARLSYVPNFLGTNGTTRLGLTHTFNETGNFASTQSSFSITDLRRWDSQHSTSLNINYSESRASVSGTTISARSVLDVRLQDSLMTPKFSAQVDFSRAIPIGSTISFLGGIDRVPELSFRTDTRRLFGPNRRVPFFSALVSLGNFIDNSQNFQVSRFFLDLRSTKTGVPANGFGIEYDAAFKQGVYGNNTAQYTPIANVRLTYQRERSFSVNVRYNYTRQHGFTPLSMDRAGRNHFVSFDALAEPMQGLKVGGQSGYDINQASHGQIAWQSPAIRIEYEPNERVRFRALANYNAFLQRWGTVRLDGLYRKGEFTVAAAANYDAVSGRWTTVNVFVDALKWGRLRTSALLRWNGFSNQFDARQFSFAYDLHCAEAILQILEDNTGFQPGRQISFFIRIKGLPFDSPFGTGRFGQPIGGAPGGGF